MSQGIRYCSKCDYEAEDGYDMDGHKWGEHDDEDLESLRCKYCDSTFLTLRDLMYHKKEKHGCIWKENDAEQIKVQAHDMGIIIMRTNLFLQFVSFARKTFKQRLI